MQIDQESSQALEDLKQTDNKFLLCFLTHKSIVKVHLFSKQINSLDAYNTLRKVLSDSRRVITHTEVNASVDLALSNIQLQLSL